MPKHRPVYFKVQVDGEYIRLWNDTRTATTNRMLAKRVANRIAKCQFGQNKTVKIHEFCDITNKFLGTVELK